MSLQINNSNQVAPIAPMTALKSCSFFNALYKNVPNVYTLNNVPFFENMDRFLDAYGDDIIDYYVEKSYVAALDKMVIENMYMVIREDILLYYNRISRDCIIMYYKTPKAKVHDVVKYILNTKGDC